LTVPSVVDSLPPRYRLILRLRYYDGCSIAEIAETLGVKPKYAQKLVSKCIKKAEKIYMRGSATESQLKGKNWREDKALNDALHEFVDPYRKVG
jgi:DNA-directed RNA polymerase specialized sigma24 family protein